VNHFDVYSAKFFGFDDDSWTVSTDKRHATVSREVRNLGSLKMAGAPNNVIMLFISVIVFSIYSIIQSKKGAA
jgi:hypothetical protein